MWKEHCGAIDCSSDGKTTKESEMYMSSFKRLQNHFESAPSMSEATRMDTVAGPSKAREGWGSLEEDIKKVSECAPANVFSKL